MLPIFLGVAPLIRGTGYPINPIDIYQLTWTTSHLIFPAPLNQYLILWLFKRSKAEEVLDKTILYLIDQYGNELANISFQVEQVKEGDQATKTNPNSLDVDQKLPEFIEKILEVDSWQLSWVRIDGMIPKPGYYDLIAENPDDRSLIGRLYFGYSRRQPLTVEEIEAIRSDPDGPKTVRLEFGCKQCDAKYRAYSGIERDKVAERQGWIWQYEINEDDFVCDCGRSNIELKYVKENLHSLLFSDILRPGITYANLYKYKEISGVIDKYNQLLDEDPKEQEIQSFIEENQTILSMFAAKRIYIKPHIIGKFQTDFVIHDAQGCLLFVEIEIPGLKLFKKDRHPTAKLMHAYGQITDWLQEYSKNQSAILESLNLDSAQVSRARGVVVAGRSRAEDPVSLQRHLMRPPYPDVDFYTFDDLASNLAQISRGLR